MRLTRQQLSSSSNFLLCSILGANSWAVNKKGYHGVLQLSVFLRALLSSFWNFLRSRLTGTHGLLRPSVPRLHR